MTWSEDIQSNSVDFASLSSAQFDNFGSFFQLEIGSQTLSYGSGDNQFSLISSANNKLSFVVNDESDYILNDNEFIRISYVPSGDNTYHVKDVDGNLASSFQTVVSNTFAPPVPSSTISDTYVVSGNVVELRLSENAKSNGTLVSAISDYTNLASRFALTVGDNSNTAFTLSSSANNTLTFTINNESIMFKMMSKSSLFRIMHQVVLTI